MNGGGKGPVSLYAVWSKIPDIVTLDPQGGEGGTTFVTATYGQPMPAITVPTRPGYEFYGYFADEQGYNDNWLDGGTRYYNSDGTSAKNWDKNSDVTLYAHWKSAKYIVTFDINGGIMQENTGYQSDPSMSKLEEITDQLIKISFTYGHGGSDDIYNAKPKMGGFKCIGFYDDDNVLVASINSNPSNYNITINKNNKYWKDGNWNWPHDVTFTARYEPKFTYENNVLDFGTETLEIGIDWSQGVIHDVVDAANYLMNEGSVSEDNPVMVVNLKNAKYLRGDLDAKYLKVPLENKPFFSPNLLVYLTNGFYDNNIIYDNLIFEGGGCKSLVVTDRFPIKIPYAFNASKASYARDANVAANDSAKVQAENSTWGTLCLPYPTKNNMNGVKFYELKSMTNNYMEFSEMSQDAVIPANTPVLYNRTDGGVGSQVKIDELNVGVPEKADFTAVNKSYSDADASIHDWEFRGNLKTTVFYGKGYVGLPSGAQILPGDVYYFKQNKFTYLNPKMEKNGKT
ncbi:MAG: InlB B-repeat-containing protein, partial [Methanobrevibacter sp.]|nr:InlB B-repeat-containing protein [Methanobrevibacter sp.]